MAAASSPASFQLDRSIFNEPLYSHIRDFWFAHLPPNASSPDEESQKKWFNLNQTQEEKERFDGDCRQNFIHALEAVAPDKYTLPAFESYEQDIEDAATNSRPFLDEVKHAQQEHGEKHGADTLLSLLLLFDQLSRNIYRDPAGLRLVFAHYDRMSFALLRASAALTLSPLSAEDYRLRPVVMQWCLIPLMHCEHLPSHDLFVNLTTQQKNNVAAAGMQTAEEEVARTLAFEEMHQEPLRKFGRYPHRNQALGRKSTKEEEEYLATAATFGVQQQGAKDQADPSDKSEL